MDSGVTVAGGAIPNGLEVVAAVVVVLLLATPHTEVVLLPTAVDAVDVTPEKGSISTMELLLPQFECEIESPPALPPLLGGT